MLLLGPPGVGKTHFGVTLGLQACMHGVCVLFPVFGWLKTIAWIRKVKLRGLPKVE